VKDNSMPPLGLMYLAAYVERCTEHEVKILDMNVGESLFNELEQWNPEVVGITTTTLTLYDALLVAQYCKEWNSNIVTVMGGDVTVLVMAGCVIVLVTAGNVIVFVTAGCVTVLVTAGCV